MSVDYFLLISDLIIILFSHFYICDINPESHEINHINLKHQQNSWVQRKQNEVNRSTPLSQWPYINTSKIMLYIIFNVHMQEWLMSEVICAKVVNTIRRKIKGASTRVVDAVYEG